MMSKLTCFREQACPSIDRLQSHYHPLHSFDLAKGDQKHYQQQYGDMYFLRLAKLKPAVEELAIEAWDGMEVGFKPFPIPPTPQTNSGD